MKINIQTNIALRVILAVFMLFAVHAKAADPTVLFEQTPLFSGTNFAPGETVTRWIKITNNTDEAHMSVLKAVNLASVKDLGSQIKIEINEGGSTIYSGSFSDLFNLSELKLKEIGPGTQKKFNLTATFLPDSKDSYQGGSLSFNIKTGLEDVIIVSDAPPVGGGGPMAPVTEKITFSEIFLEQNNGDDSLNVKWNTNLPATSRVVYGPVSMGPYSANLNSQNIGYLLSTKENPLPQNTHSVELTGLIPGEEYYFRIISEAGMFNASQEYVLKLDK
ncbi:MAG TPA: fibronectin type III domain-containing protein, partial [Candidatus Paceibacterota bacterium]|nr:fibronectin type III domain-containing protein [Candidatus Paceibacterota bacterium]